MRLHASKIKSPAVLPGGPTLRWRGTDQFTTFASDRTLAAAQRRDAHAEEHPGARLGHVAGGNEVANLNAGDVAHEQVAGERLRGLRVETARRREGVGARGQRQGVAGGHREGRVEKEIAVVRLEAAGCAVQVANQSAGLGHRRSVERERQVGR